MTNAEIIEKTKEEIRLRGLTESTEYEYLTKLKVFMNHYENRKISEMGEEEIRSFLLHLVEH